MPTHRPPFVHASTSYAEQHSGSSLPAYTPHAPYTDYPPEKSEAAAPIHQLEEEDAHHAHVPFRQQNSPARGIYGHRRSPIALDAGSSGSSWPWRRSQPCPSAGGGLGKALMIGWVGTTVLFIVATAFWKGELFRALDRLSSDLREMGYQGQIIFGFLIFLTTIPPLPLYSTLMVLSGYTFGAGQGFVISYFASLIGAVLVFVLTRTFLKDCITKCLSSSPTSMSLLQIIPSRPDLLLLVRIAPYPYNLLNVILASARDLSLRTYTGCTAISLLKVILHTWFGAGIHDISEMHRSPRVDKPHHPHEHHHHDHHGHHGQPVPQIGEYPGMRDDVKFYGTWGGVGLCVVLFIYLHHIAKKAISRAQAEAERDGRVEEGHHGLEVVQVPLEDH